MKYRKIGWVVYPVFVILMAGCAGGSGPLAWVENYEQTANAHNPEDIIALYAEEFPRLVILGDITFYDREEILAYIEYECGLEAIYKFNNCTAEELSATCEAVMTDALGEAAGWGELHYPKVVFSFTETGLVQKIEITPTAEEERAAFATFSEFIPWVEEVRPTEFDKLFGTTGFIFNEANALLIVDLMEQWKGEE